MPSVPNEAECPAKRTSGVATLVGDRFTHWMLKRIVARSKKTGMFSQPLVVAPSDSIGKRIIATGSFERTQFEALDRLLSDSSHFFSDMPPLEGVFLDVGANIGLYTIRYSKSFEKTIAIEANPATYHALMANILMSRCQNVDALGLAASDIAGKAEINVAVSGEIGWSRMNKVDWWETYSVEVETRTLDEIVAEKCEDTRVGLLKIDVEGFESQVLRGGKNTLMKHHPLVLFEVNQVADGDVPCQLLQQAEYNRFYTFRKTIGLRGSQLIAERFDPSRPKASALACAFRAV